MPLPIWDVFDTRTGQTLGFAHAKDVYQAVLRIAEQLDKSPRGMDADLVPVSELDRVYGLAETL